MFRPGSVTRGDRRRSPFTLYARALWELLQSIFDSPRHLVEFIRHFCRFLHLPKRCEAECGRYIPASVYKRADPFIYPQEYLIANGLSAWWDNPDIALYKNNELVKPSRLSANAEYDILIRIWNNSYDAPALGVEVTMSYLPFGIATDETYIGKTLVNLAGKASTSVNANNVPQPGDPWPAEKPSIIVGAFGYPALAQVTWRTPAFGHHCLRANLHWHDDANPNNNWGQKNVDVQKMKSPAEFRFPVQNNRMREVTLELEADFYELPPLLACRDNENLRRTLAEFETLNRRRFSYGNRERGRLLESQLLWRYAEMLHGYGLYPITNDWHVEIVPNNFVLAPRDQQEVKVVIERRSPGFHGRKVVNVHGFARFSTGEREIIGGVTLYVDGDG